MKSIKIAPRSPRQIDKARELYAAGQYRAALKEAERAEHIYGKSANASYWQMAAALGLLDTKRAADILGDGLQHFPGDVELMSLGGFVLLRNGDHEGARRLLLQCVTTAPAAISGWVHYAALLLELREPAAAKEAALKALALDPNEPVSACNYGIALKETGEMVEAIAALRKAVRLAPENPAIRANLLFVMLFAQDTTALDLLREAKAYEQLLLARQRLPHSNPAPRENGGPIRLGLISNDLMRHPCAYFILPLLANLDRTRIEVMVFSLNPRSDRVTDKIRSHANRYFELAGKPKANIVDVIRGEQLDVLVDLGGHTGTSPLPYMVHRLAPVQMTWLGYPGSTGMAAIDYRISDWTADPAGFEPHYTETLLRAPDVFCTYSPLVHSPLEVYEEKYRVQETPALQIGRITFGSCNNLGKITDQTIALWGTVMTRCPDSRLLIEARDIDSDSVSAPLLARLAKAGIAPDRVSCIPRLAKNQYLTYHDIDIVLDTLPLTGGTTTCDALWMGVPVVTLAGTAFHSRMSASFVHTLGLSGLACGNEAEYADVAVQLATDIEGLNGLRLSLRQRFEQSPVADGAAFARWMEAQLTVIVAQRRVLQNTAPGPKDGVYFSGTWHTTAEIVIAIAGLLDARRYAELRGLLENFSAKWPKHWIVPYVLAEIEHHTGQPDAVVGYLMESIGLRTYHLPLYRLLNARMDEYLYDKSALGEFLQQQFGMSLDILSQQGTPTMLEVLGIEVGQAREAEFANT
ncbi:tetratricopeptide repeat protein [Cupriavidus sp. WS]|uniref:O-linked N-acetylglucosamine transferase, SPINDLY family protein n=1 Tax=Cupriavidus sp. WS TaxID=1312922 RepID=UPI0003A2F0D9|nr:tetratricopeptide repeat protein [Cupriavidus sp. WS]